ncbi:hypothetical protein, partial [Listeria monocytogenes]
ASERKDMMAAFLMDAPDAGRSRNLVRMPSAGQKERDDLTGSRHRLAFARSSQNSVQAQNHTSLA